MAFLDRVLDPPSYGFEKNGKLVIPTRRQLFHEFFSRLNILKSRKAWLPFFSWFIVLILAPAIVTFFVLFGLHLNQPYYWKLFLIAFIYSMVILGTHGTIYLHRYGTHHAFTFTNKFWLFTVRQMVIKLIPEEVYIVSHHVHHYISEKPGDPYNVHGGALYCFLADVNHQMISQDLTPDEYEKVAGLVGHTGVRINTYQQYKKWGSICNPYWTTVHFLLNWIFWGVVFYLLGGWMLVLAIFAGAGFWAIGVRTYNYAGHGGGKDKRKEGSDFDRTNLSINQAWPGLVTGEWHNNHHLYPNGIRAGFLPYQWDYAWIFIRFYIVIKAIDTWRDHTEEFFLKHYEPYLKQKAMEKGQMKMVKS
jgi:stearoyl-CoA desaturase (delta-9 desaturase)